MPEVHAEDSEDTPAPSLSEEAEAAGGMLLSDAAYLPPPPDC